MKEFEFNTRVSRSVDAGQEGTIVGVKWDSMKTFMRFEHTSRWKGDELLAPIQLSDVLLA